MLSADVMRQIRRIELRTRRLVNDSFAGSYHAVFKGRGITFDAVRAYEPGDDVRDIDWNVTARTGDPYIKQYVEERELTVMLVLDASASILFGSVKWLKRDLAAELGAVLALSAISNNDKVGLLVFSDQIELFIPPRKGRNHVLRLIRDLMAAEPTGQGTDLVLALKTINGVLKRRAIVFLISDFLMSSDDYLRELMITSRRHDVIAVTISDRLEQAWPDVGLVKLEDAETGLTTWVDTGPRAWRRGFSIQAQRFQKARDEALVRARVDRIDLPSDGDYVRALAQFFKRRERHSRL
ncbi:MAG: DUF58 domain-containing protein [Anaerolineae bacterium]|nr:DUF58 domain-containing protein [Anaerolineae bacterium]